jgi:hypothetical protein
MISGMGGIGWKDQNAILPTRLHPRRSAGSSFPYSKCKKRLHAKSFSSFANHEKAKLMSEFFL